MPDNHHLKYISIHVWAFIGANKWVYMSRMYLLTTKNSDNNNTMEPKDPCFVLPKWCLPMPYQQHQHTKCSDLIKQNLQIKSNHPKVAYEHKMRAVLWPNIL